MAAATTAFARFAALDAGRSMMLSALAPVLLHIGLLAPPVVDLEPLTVSVRADQASADAAIAVARLDGDEVAKIQATHPAEWSVRVPGVWISRGSGQEQLTAIRSPVLTGPGACGAFLWLEDGVSIRPAGFCNLNQLFEVDSGQVASIEVLRGPGTAAHGSNALHGLIAIRSPDPRRDDAQRVALELGADAGRRLRVGTGDAQARLPWRVDGNWTDAGSFRIDEAYRQAGLRAALAGNWSEWDWVGRIAVSALRQQTAGFVVGADAWRDPVRRRENANPGAFRDGDALRAQLAMARQTDSGLLRVTPYLRRDQQTFLQHFILGQPLERNGSRSAGLLLRWDRPDGLVLGKDLEAARGDLLQIQASDPQTGTPAQRAIRPAGVHYNYQVDSLGAAVFAERYWTLGAWRVDLGWRWEVLDYDYRNRAADGNLRDDGSACSFGGCLYNRPSNRRDRFSRSTPKLAVGRALGTGWVWTRYSEGFRFPQAGELYRLQRGQQVAELAAEQLDSIELGWRGTWGTASVDAVAYAMHKRDSIVRDAEGFTLVDGSSRHRGLELDWRQALGASVWWSLNAQYAIQRYAFERELAGGEQVRLGNEVDTAPRLLLGTRLGWQGTHLRSELEWSEFGGYFLDAANTARYDGHHLLNLRLSGRLDEHWHWSARVMNLADRRYAERVDLAFGQIRSFPGAGRSLFVGLQGDW